MTNTYQNFPKHPPPKVVIFGAGVTGLTVAHELVERGWDVTMVEPEIDPLNVDACAVGGLAKTQWSVYQPATRTGNDEPTALRPMVPNVRLRALHSIVLAELNSTSLQELGVGTNMEEVEVRRKLQQAPIDPIRQLLGRILDSGSQTYLKRIERRIHTILPFAPNMAVRYGAPGRQDPWVKLIAWLIAVYLERLGVGHVVTGESSELPPGVWQVGTDLSDQLSGFKTPNQPLNPSNSLMTAAILPGEHGFRFFPALYRNLFDTLRRIPVRGEDQSFGDAYRTVYDNLLATEANWLALDDADQRPGSETARQRGIVRFPRRLRKSLRESFDALNDMYTELGYTARDVELLKLRLFKYMTSCKKRRNEQYEGMSWADFMGLSDLSGIARQDMERAPQLLAAMTATQSDARTQGNLATQLLLDPINADERVDSTLNAPTTVAWLSPWKDYLVSQGVRFAPGRLTGFELDASKTTIRPVVEFDGPGPEKKVKEDADYYVLAIPIQAWSDDPELFRTWIVARDQLKAGPDHIERLNVWLKTHVHPEVFDLPDSNMTTLYKGLTGIQFYLEADDLTRSGHTLYVDSPWRLSAISQASFWNRRREPFDGYRGIVSVDIGLLKYEPCEGEPKPFAKTARDQVHALVWGQMEALEGGETVPYRMYRLDEYITYADPKGLPTDNTAPFLINGVGEWDYRPGWYDPCWDKNSPFQEPEFELAEEDSSARYQLMPVLEREPCQTRQSDDKPSQATPPISLPKWVLAGTFMQTWTRATTMESANESAKHAVNTLLAAAQDSHGRRAQLCRIWNPEKYEHPDLRIWQELDQKLYGWESEPLPHMVDILELDAVPDALLEGDLSHLAGKSGRHGPHGDHKP